MASKDMLDKMKDFFTVKTILIVIICVLSIILVLQNFHIFGGSRRPGNDNGNHSNFSSQMKLPSMMGGGMGSYKRQRD